ncbi:ribosome biogenesis protein NOP53 [Periplaneta americana]|uniref:ribosome biogenesis protein NOP53 n=1 Tax=Periplaneta americana TaxID=6978 RepID=UPI0037E97936
MVSEGNKVGNVAKKKKVSKKTKKSWRKHIDTKDVDSFLDDKRLEERLGKPFAERHDDELFQIDTEANANYELKEVSSGKKSQKPVKCFEILELRSAVPDPITKRNRVRTPEERKHPARKRIEADRRARGILKAKEIEAQKNRILAEQKKAASRPKRGEFNNDLWEEPETAENVLGPDSEWLTPTTKFHVLKNTGNLKKKMPDNFLTKPSETPAVQIPHPGISYNPTYGDHQNLLQEVANKEIELIKEEKHLHRVTSKMFSRITETERENTWMKEMSQGLPTKVEMEIKQENESDNEYRAINPPAKNVKKTLKQRRKMKEAQKEQLQRKGKLTEKKKVSDLYRMKFLAQELEARDKKLARLRAKREKIKAIKVKEPKQLGKRKFEPLSQEFNLGYELKGNIRGIKPEGNILEDRFKSLQMRNIVEPTIRNRIKKAKVKRYERKSHKMGWEPQGY